MFDKVVFAGGGHRCWWQAGFWEQLSGEIELHPRVIGGVSAGAATACLLYANDSRRALAWYERELKGRRSNINWFNLVRRGERLLPHAAIYRKALRALLGGENFRQLMWRAPEIRVQYSRLPEGMGPNRALLSGMLAYNLEKYWHGSLHPTFGQRMGFTHEVKRVQDCRNERELVDLLVASSCTPPFTPVEMIDGLPCLDGGLVDNVPIGTVADVPGQTLVLTTRRYKSFAPVFARNGLIYVQPSEKVAASSWDYTSPAKYQKTYDLGRRDAVEFLKTFALGRYNDVVPNASPAGSEQGGDGRSGADASAPGAQSSVDGPMPGAVAAASATRALHLAGTAPAVAALAGGTAGATGPAMGTGAMPTRAEPYGDGAAHETVVPYELGEMRATGEGVLAGPDGYPEDQEGLEGSEDLEDLDLEPMSSLDATVASGETVERSLPRVPVDGMPEEESSPAGLHNRVEAGRGAKARPIAARPVYDEEDDTDVLDFSARLADYREPSEAGTAEDLSASQPAASDGQDRSGRSLRVSRI